MLFVVMKYVSALIWQQQGPQQSGKFFKQRREDEASLQKMNFNQIELEFRHRVNIIELLALLFKPKMASLVIGQRDNWHTLHTLQAAINFKVKIWIYTAEYLNIHSILFSCIIVDINFQIYFTNNSLYQNYVLMTYSIIFTNKKVAGQTKYTNNCFVVLLGKFHISTCF